MRAWNVGTRKLMLGLVASLLLAGCGGTPAPPDASPASSTSDPSAGSSAADDPTDDAGDRTAGERSDGQAGEESGGGSADGSGGTTDDGGSGSSSGSGTSGDGSSEGGAGLEMPEAPEETEVSLSDLLEEQSDAPLVSTPLPRAANASERLVTGFPVVLRPTERSRVGTSSISPSGDRLQVALVASTTLAPEQVLVAYRTRLTGRGLVERTAPPATPGSVVAAFRRGRSVVTLTVTPEGPRTTYSVQASLRAGGA